MEVEGRVRVRRLRMGLGDGRVMMAGERRTVPSSLIRNAKGGMLAIRGTEVRRDETPPEVDEGGGAGDICVIVALGVTC